MPETELDFTKINIMCHPDIKKIWHRKKHNCFYHTINKKYEICDFYGHTYLNESRKHCEFKGRINYFRITLLQVSKSYHAFIVIFFKMNNYQKSNFLM